MKQIILLTAILISLQTMAQKPSGKHLGEMMHHRMSFLKDLSAEQIANIQTKRMTFYLDLSESQIIEVKKINLQVAKLRKAKSETFNNRIGKGKSDSQEMYKMMNERLDHQIKIKKQFKNILSEKQMEKWETMQLKHHGMNYGKPHFKENLFNN